MTSPSARSFRVLIVDDESPARTRIADLLRRDPEVSGILEADNGATAVEMIRQQAPDLVFLDVQMPELDGLGVVASVGAERMPLTIFVTAYDRHALDAFEANALDYLLKPFSDERHEAALARAKARLRDRDASAFGERLLRLSSRHAEPYLDRFVLKSQATIRFLNVADVEWIEATGVYVTLHAGATQWLYRAALGALAAALDPRRFVRVHRSTVVNVDAIDRLEPASHGEFEIVLKSGSRCRVSRSYRGLLEQRLGQPL